MIAQRPPGAAPVVRASAQAVRANISVFSLIDATAVIARLEADLAGGAWHERHGHLLSLVELDLGYRLLVG